jgi:hypothetical protein
VHPGSFHLRIAAALAIAAALGGCGDLDAGQPWFRKPLNFTGQAGGYTFSDLEGAKLDRPITENDLIGANGSCVPMPAQVPPAPGNQTASPASAPTIAPDSSSQLGEGVALGMSECEVVYRVGAPSNLELGKNPNGDRTAVLTYQSGPRPGIYRFERGRLMEIDSVAAPAPPPVTAKKTPAKPKKPVNNAT